MGYFKKPDHKQVTHVRVNALCESLLTVFYVGAFFICSTVTAKASQPNIYMLTSYDS